MPTGSRFSCFVSISVYYYTLSNIVIFLSNVLCVDKNTSYSAILSFISSAQKIALNWQPTIRKIFMFIICLRFVFVYLWPNDKTSSKKYVNINGNVSKDKWQSMFRYLAWWSMNSRYFPFATFTPVFLPPPLTLIDCMLDNSQIAMLRGFFIQPLTRIVSRTIIHTDDFIEGRGQWLFPYTFQADWQIM